jgi:hypothetical protein
MESFLISISKVQVVGALVLVPSVIPNLAFNFSEPISPAAMCGEFSPYRITTTEIQEGMWKCFERIKLLYE